MAPAKRARGRAALREAVEVLRRSKGAVKLGGDAADDEVLDVVAIKGGEDALEIEGRLVRT
jgi:Holliday junction resolvase